MAFESLAHRHTFVFHDFPERWLPLMQLYDPDLPLFPVMYFHRAKHVPQGARPLDHERVFGYVESSAPTPAGLEVTIVTNKALGEPLNAEYLTLAKAAVSHRLGLADPVTRDDLVGAFKGTLAGRDPVLKEIWQRVVANPYGDRLPFGRLWDEVLGLARFVASFFSEAGRKGELIQTHYFAKRFGVEIQTANPVPQRDFFLLPSITEIQDNTNPLSSFPEFAALIAACAELAEANGKTRTCGSAKPTTFSLPAGSAKLTGEVLQAIISTKVGYGHQAAAREALNAFNKGAHRTVLGMFLLHDVRNGNLRPAELGAEDFGALYDGLEGSYLSPKVIAIYAQQCFGNPDAIPIDTWITTMMRYPLGICGSGKKKRKWTPVLANSVRLGKVERLLWVTAQARKVHSRACDDAVWCIKKGTKDTQERGANPLTCTVCLPAIRNACPAYESVRTHTVAVNAAGANFEVKATGTRFLSCEGHSACGEIEDIYTAGDNPYGFAPYPVAQHKKPLVTVEEFVGLYRT